MIRLSADEVEILLVAMDGMASQLAARAEAFGHGRAHLQAVRLLGSVRRVRRVVCAGLVEAVCEGGCDAEVELQRC